MGIEHMLYRQKSMVRYQALHTPTHYHNPQNRAGEIAQDSGQLLHMLDHSLIWKPHHSLRPTIYSPENSCTQHHWVWARRSLVQSNNTFPGPCIESSGCVGLELLGVYKISRIVKIILRKMKRYQVIYFLTLNYTIRIKECKLCGTGIKTLGSMEQN